jgi:hypothetical protein
MMPAAAIAACLHRRKRLRHRLAVAGCTLELHDARRHERVVIPRRHRRDRLAQWGAVGLVPAEVLGHERGGDRALAAVRRDRRVWRADVSRAGLLAVALAVAGIDQDRAVASRSAPRRPAA